MTTTKKPRRDRMIERVNAETAQLAEAVADGTVSPTAAEKILREEAARAVKPCVRGSGTCPADCCSPADETRRADVTQQAWQIALANIADLERQRDKLVVALRAINDSAEADGTDPREIVMHMAGLARDVLATAGA